MDKVIHRVNNRQGHREYPKIKITGRSVASLLFGLAILSYLVFHSIEGKRGVYVLHDLEQALIQEKEILAALKAEKEILEKERFYLAYADNYPDYVDEVIRTKLGYVDKDDKIIIMP